MSHKFLNLNLLPGLVIIMSTMTTIQSVTGQQQIQLNNIYELLEYYNDPIRHTESQEPEADEYMESIAKVWAPRLYPSGDMEPAAAALLDYAEDFWNGEYTTFPVDWHFEGPIASNNASMPYAGRMHRLTFDPFYGQTIDNTLIKTVYTCSNHGGLWRSDDAGESWFVLNTDTQLPECSAADVAVSFQNRDHLFLATGQSDDILPSMITQNIYAINPVYTLGVYKSLDGGEHWQQAYGNLLSFFENGGTIRKIAVNPSNENQVVISTSIGVFRTNNILDQQNEIIWEMVLDDGFQTNLPPNFRGIEYKPENSSVIYASADAVWKSIDGGDNFTNISGLVNGFDLMGITDTDFQVKLINIAVTPASGAENFLYAYVIGSVPYTCPNGNQMRQPKGFICIYDGSIWHNIFNHITPIYYNSNTNSCDYGWVVNISPTWCPIAVHPTNPDRVVIGFTQVIGNVDNNELQIDILNPGSPNFQFLGGYDGSGDNHADCRDLNFEPVATNGNTERLFSCNDGGVCVKSSIWNGSTGWNRKMLGLNVMTHWSFDDSDKDDEVFITANQDNGVSYISPANGITNWSNSFVGDGYAAQVCDQFDRFFIMGNSSVSSKDLAFGNSKNEGTTGGVCDDTGTTANELSSSSAPPDNNANCKAIMAQTFKIHENPKTGETYIGFSEIYQRLKATADANTNNIDPSDLWATKSDINENSDLGWRGFRLINEFEISPSNPEYVYVTTTGSLENGTEFPYEDGYLYSNFLVCTNWSQLNNNSDITFLKKTSNLPEYNANGDAVPGLITGIAVSPSDAQHLWVSFTGFDDDLKVYESFDAGNTWNNADPNGDLPNIPINAIAIHPGSQNRLFIGTDAGVWMKDENSNNWVKYGTMPNVRVTEIKINVCANEIRACTFGRGVWSAALPQIANQTLEIDFTQASETWTGVRYLNGNLKIHNGSHLTISGELRMAAKSRIIVEPNAKLTIDGGIITNVCDQLWSGIEVWGNQCLTQSAANQGTVELLNGAIIEHAQCAIRTGNLASTTPTWQYDWAKTGGIIKAANSTFRNNRKDVEFLSYQNFAGGTCLNPTILLANKSTFTNCNFEVTEKVLGGGSTLDTRVSMYDVHGVRFTSCNWKIYGDALTVYNKHQRGKGIYSIVASYIVGGRCTQSLPLGGECEPNMITGETLDDTNDDIIPSEFENLSYAIRSLGPDGYSKVSISTCIFRNNLRGIYLLACADPYLVRNKFFIPPFSFSDPDEPDALSSINSYYGMSLNECTGYNMRRNYFTTNTPNNNRTVGVWITSSGPETNEIYLNDFHNLYAGSIAQGINQNEETDLDGLEMLCGLYQNCEYDLALTHSAQVALYQGSSSLNDPTAPAGNIFDNSGVHDEGDYFVSENSEFLVYWHHDPNSNFNVIPEYRTSNKVIPSPTENVILTSRNQGCPKVKRDESDPHLLHEKVLEKRTSIQEIQGILYVLMDNGNTELLLTYVQNPNNTSSEVRQLLLEASPFCSSDILIAAMKRNPAMNQWHLCEVLLANSPLNPATWLEYQKDMPLASFLDALLTQYQTGTNARINTEDLLKKEKQEKDRALSNYIRAQLIHTNNETYLTQEIKDLLAAELDYDQNKRIRTEVAILRAEGKYADAEELLASYNEDEQYDVWKEFGEVLLSLKHDGGSSITETEIATLQDLAGTGKFGSGRAAALLELLTGVQTEEILILPDETLRSLKIKQEKKMPQLSGVYPNPASGAFYITYVLPTERQSAFIRIFDLKGALVHEENITAGYGITELNSTNFENGQYIFDLVLNNEVVATNKFQIMN